MKNLLNNNSKPGNYTLELNNKYISIQNMLTSVKQGNEDNFCTQKYLLYHMLEEVQNQYVSETNTKLIKYTKLQDSTNIVQNTTVQPSKKTHSAATPVKYINLVHKSKDLNDNEQDYVNLADEYIQREI
jgi:hypothetical protein